jgi:putative DNA primase/helicase
MSLYLGTGIKYQPRREDYVTKEGGCHLAPEGSECHIWLSFLNRVMGGDQDLIDYLQRVCGYCMMAASRNTPCSSFMAPALTGRACSLVPCAEFWVIITRPPIETFTAQRSGGHPTDLAGLMGARLVTAVETEEGRVWAEPKLKAITGGDEISARFMRQDFFHFPTEVQVDDSRQS